MQLLGTQQIAHLHTHPVSSIYSRAPPFSCGSRWWAVAPRCEPQRAVLLIAHHGRAAFTRLTPFFFSWLQLAAVGACVGLATVYVGALYMVTPHEHRAVRDDPVCAVPNFLATHSTHRLFNSLFHSTHRCSTLCSKSMFVEHACTAACVTSLSNYTNVLRPCQNPYLHPVTHCSCCRRHCTSTQYLSVPLSVSLFY